MSVDTHRIERSLRHLVLGARVAQDRKKAQDKLWQMSEVDQEVQVRVSGEASAPVGWSDEITIPFEWWFIAAPEQRDSPYEKPTFTFGYQSEQEVVLTARLLRWIEEPGRSVITGVVVSFGAYRPGAEDTIRYQGVVHLMFQGLAVPPEDEEVLDLGE